VNKPLVITHGTRQGGSVSFVTRSGECVISEHVDLILSILPYCNGLNTINDIAENTSRNYKTVKDIIEALEKLEIVRDSSELYTIFFKDIQFNSQYRNAIDPNAIKTLMSDVSKHRVKQGTDIAKSGYLIDNLMSRRTVRAFDPNSKISVKVLMRLLNRMYFNEGHSTVPSAGSLYPLEFYIIILQAIEDIEPGGYIFSPIKSTLINISGKLPEENLRYIFGEKDIFKNAQFIICVSAEIDTHPKKYGNRGLAYTLIEVGHVAQNVQLLVTGEQLGVLECGGFFSDHLEKLLGMSNSKHVILPMIIGVPNKAAEDSLYELSFRMTQKLWSLMDRYVGEKKLIQWIDAEELSLGDHYMPRVSCLASFETVVDKRDRRKGFSFATGYSTIEAATKTIAEAVERYACGLVKHDLKGSLVFLADQGVNILNPTSVYQVNKLWYKRKSIKDRYEDFDKNKQYEWVYGNELYSKKKIAVLIDQVFFPIFQDNIKRKLIYNVSSSGVAAHFDRLEAQKKALLELIERDAIAKLWYFDVIPQEIPEKLLPTDLRDRSTFWKNENGSQLRFFDITNGLTPTVLAVIRRSTYPFFVVGASSAFNYYDALLKAFDELEATLLSWIQEKSISVGIEDIESPHDHGIYYAHQKNSKYLNWLFNENIEKATNLGGYSGSLEDLFKTLKAVEVVVHDPESVDDLWVCRMISDKLIPLNFGFGNEPVFKIEPNIKPRWANHPTPPHFFP